MLTALYPWIVFVHVAAAFSFVLAHGVAVFISFRIRRERDRARVAALLDHSTASLPMMYVSLLILVVAGFGAGVIGGWLGQPWVWLSIAVLVAVAVGMSLIASRHYRRVRQLVGASITPRAARSLEPLGEPARVEAELAARLRSRVPEVLAAIGGGGLLTVIMLMVIKPF
jgi:uncharacterized membrane protein